MRIVSYKILIHDSNGNITSVKETTGNTTKTTTYVYDSANQLIRENNQSAGKTWVWTYDDAGNITSRKEYAYTTGSLGSVLSTVNYTYGDSSWGDLLTGWNGKSFSYDTIGNLTSDGTWSYTWEHGRELASMSGGGTAWNFTYNADGLRTKRTNGSTTYSYVYNGSSLSQMTVGGNTLYFAYDASGTPLSVTYNGTNYYYATNIQGDVTAILNASGTAVVQYAYDAWGKLLSTTGSMASTLGAHNPLRYRGYVYDTETGLYYLQSRYYDPAIGRFINADALTSTGQGLLGNNMFTYCHNNPVNCTDPTGYLLSHFSRCLKDSPGNKVYNSEEDAAFAAGVLTREATNRNDREYICGVYELESGGFVTGVCYVGEHASVNPNSVMNEYSTYGDRALVAMVHSHPYCNGHVPNEFSKFDAAGNPTGDLLCALFYEIPIYLAAPNGSLMAIYPYDVHVLNNGRCYRYVEATICAGLPVDNTKSNCIFWG